MKYSPGIKALAAFAGIATLIGFGLTGASIGFAVHSMATRTTTLLPTLATGTSSQVAMVLAGTTALVIGLIAAFLLYRGRTPDIHNANITLKSGKMIYPVTCAMVGIVLVTGLGYVATHLGIRPALAPSYSGLALSGVEAACGAGMAAIIPFVFTIIFLILNDIQSFEKGCIATTIVTALAGAGSALAGPALASLVGAIGSEAIAIECMAALVLSMAPVGVFLAIT